MPTGAAQVVHASILRTRHRIRVWVVINEAHVLPDRKPGNGPAGLSRGQDVELTAAAVKVVPEAAPRIRMR